MIIDSHAHLTPQSLIDIIRKERSRFPNVRVIEEGGSIALAFAGGKPTRPVSKVICAMPRRAPAARSSGCSARRPWPRSPGIRPASRAS